MTPPTASIFLNSSGDRFGQLRGSTHWASSAKGASVSNSEKIQVAALPSMVTRAVVHTSSPTKAVSEWGSTVAVRVLANGVSPWADALMSSSTV